MKSIFTRPVFINPLAYSVIPELMLINRSIPYDFSSNQYVFQVITTGLIKGKLLLAGNEYILHLDLYSKDGNVVLGEFYLDGSSIGNVDDFTLELSNGFVTITFVGGNISYPGLIAAWSAKGKSNDDEDRAILKDLTGNGHDITLNGFAYSGMSGYGGYKKSFTIRNNKYQYCELINNQTIRIYKRTFAGIAGNMFDDLFSTDGIRTIKLRVSGITEENKQNNTRVCIDLINDDKDNWETYDNGIFEVSYKTTYTNKAPVGIVCNGDTDDNINITVEILPEYPDALVFDGVDDYGINENMPILTDYTVIVKRIFSSGTTISKSKIIGYGAFIMEVREQNLTYSFGYNSPFTSGQNPIVYQNKHNYNGTFIHSDSNKYDNNVLYLGCARPIQLPSKGAFYSAYLFDRSLDEQEIKSFIRKYIDPEYLLPSEQYLVLNQGKLNINKLK